MQCNNLNYFHYLSEYICVYIWFPANSYLLKGNNRNTGKMCRICSKLTIEPPKWLQCLRSGIFIVTLLNIFHPFFYCWLWTCECLLRPVKVTLMINMHNTPLVICFTFFLFISFCCMCFNFLGRLKCVCVNKISTLYYCLFCFKYLDLSGNSQTRNIMLR